MAHRQQWRIGSKQLTRLRAAPPTSRSERTALRQSKKQLPSRSCKKSHRRSGSKAERTGRNFMNTDSKGDGFENSSGGSPPTAAAPRTDDRQPHFIVPWRLKPDLLRQRDDAGCGSCPVD
jgi:hypothetical protein